MSANFSSTGTGRKFGHRKEIIELTDFYRKNSNCLSTNNINNNDIKMVLKIEDDGGNILQKSSPSIIFKTEGRVKLEHFGVNSTAYA